MLREVKL